MDDLIAYKDKLNTYSKIIHKEIPQIGKSYYWLIGQLNSLKDIKLLENNFDEEFDNLNHNKFNEIIDVLETLKERIEQIGLPITHNFWGTEISSTSEQHRQTLNATLKKYDEKLKDIIDEINSLNDSVGLNIITISMVDKYSKLFKILTKKHQINEDFLCISDAEEYYKKIKKDLNIIKKYQMLLKNINKSFEDDFLLEFEFKKTRRLLRGELSSFFRFLNKDYWKITKQFKGYLKDNDFNLNYDSMLKLCDNAIAANDAKAKIDNLSDKDFNSLGDLWKNENSNISSIESSLKWLIEYQKSKVSQQDDKILKNIYFK